MNKVVNLHIYPSELTNESRMFKEAQSLIYLNLVDEVYLLGYRKDDLPAKEKIGKSIYIIRLKTLLRFDRNKVVRYLAFFEFLIRALFKSLRMNIAIVNCHSLHVLPIGVLMKRIKKISVIYDAHELETEVSGSKGILNKAAKLIEGICIKYADKVIVVSDSIREWYMNTYHISNVTAIYNAPNPLLRRTNTLSESIVGFRDKYDISNNETLFLYQGFLSQQRGVDTILSAFQDVEKSKHIIFMGNGPLKFEIIESSKQNSNVHYHPSVEPAQLLRYTEMADVGIHVIRNSCLNHYYCLPNKLFEYIAAGVPFIISDFPEMSKVAVGTNGGWKIAPSKSELLSKISTLTKDEIEEKKTNLRAVRNSFTWKKEELKYVKIYEELIQSRNENFNNHWG